MHAVPETWLQPSALLQAELAFRQGVEAQAAGVAAQARAQFERAIALWPGCAAAWSNLGLLHEDAADVEQAIACYERALALEPELFSAALNLGTALVNSRRYAQAEQAYGRALGLRPESPEVWSNLGALLAAQGRLDEALDCCWHALRLDPGYDKARFNLSYPLLRRGRYAEGFVCMEARESSVELQRQLRAPRWAGDPLDGRGLLLVSDAGHGDVIQMARYASLLKAGGAGRLVFYGQAGLCRLLAESGSWDAVLSFDQPLPTAGWDVWAPVMSLPYLCPTDLEDVPAALPYLHADAARQAVWHRRLLDEAPHALLRIGLVWRGNPRHENDAERSLPQLGTLAPLLQLPGLSGVRFYSLQSGAGAEDLAQAPPDWPLALLDAELGDFAETAALVAQLDLVIGVDTSMVHLAGALGVPVWVLLSQHKPDWRWLDGRSDSPWYPGVMRLFRQQVPGDWAGVLDEVAAALRAGVAGSGFRTRRADAAPAP